MKAQQRGWEYPSEKLNRLLESLPVDKRKEFAIFCASSVQHLIPKNPTITNAILSHKHQHFREADKKRLLHDMAGIVLSTLKKRQESAEYFAAESIYSALTYSIKETKGSDFAAAKAARQALNTTSMIDNDWAREDQINILEDLVNSMSRWHKIKQWVKSWQNVKVKKQG